MLGDKSIPYVNDDPYFSLTELRQFSDISNVKIAKWDSSGGITTPSLYYICGQTVNDSIQITMILMILMLVMIIGFLYLIYGIVLSN